MSAKEAAQGLLSLARESRVRFPSIWDESKTLQNCGTVLLLHRAGSGFDEQKALKDLIDKYGLEQQAANTKVVKTDDQIGDAPSSSGKKRKSGKSDQGAEDEAEWGDEQDGKDAKKQKVKKSEVVAVEENRSAAEAIMEMAKVYFQNKDMRKGGVFSKAAKAIRECDFAITDRKSAMKLKGVGKGIAGYIDELLETGKITKLEELRAGIA